MEIIELKSIIEERENMVKRFKDQIIEKDNFIFEGNKMINELRNSLEKIAKKVSRKKIIIGDKNIIWDQSSD